MKSKISCWRFVRSLPMSIRSASSVRCCVGVRTCVRDTSAPRGRTQAPRPMRRPRCSPSGQAPPGHGRLPYERMATEATPAAAPLSYLGGRSFVDDRALLLELFTAVLAASEGEQAVALHERAAALGKRSRAGDHAATRELEELVAGLSVTDAQVLMRSLSRWFQLINLAEDNERIRRLRRRE